MIRPRPREKVVFILDSIDWPDLREVQDKVKQDSRDLPTWLSLDNQSSDAQ